MLIINVCVKLYYVRVDNWLRHNRPKNSFGTDPSNHVMDYEGMFEDGTIQRDTIEDDMPTNANTMEGIENKYTSGQPRAKRSQLRDSIKDHIFNCGIRWTADSSNDFLTLFDL